MPKAAQPPSSDPEEHAQRDHVVPFPRSPQQQQEQRSSHNLPLELSSFVGREREIAEVSQLLLVEEDNNRLLTLTGSGGCGKTRLALSVASEVVEAFVEDGVWLVELASPSDPDLVPQAVASTLGVREQPGRSLTATLVDALRPRRMLLVLDNCEHLMEACAARGLASHLPLLAHLGGQALGLGHRWRESLACALAVPARFSGSTCPLPLILASLLNHLLIL